MSDGQITRTISEHVALLTLDRPNKANAVTPDMARQLTRLCAEADADDDVRVIVLTGAGRTFSAGSDINTLAQYPTPWAFRSRIDYCDAILNLRKPAIAAVNGPAFGGGLEMAISCDVRVAAASARFAAPEVGLGWLGGGGASQLLPRLVGFGNAARMLLTGDPVTAQDALRLGLVQEVVDEGDVVDTAMTLARRIARNAPIATQAAKAAMRVAMSTNLADGMAYEEELVAVCMATADRHEGIAAFNEKRAPRFEGM